MNYKNNTSFGYQKNTYTTNINTSLNKQTNSFNIYSNNNVYFKYTEPRNKEVLNYAKENVRKSSPK